MPKAAVQIRGEPRHHRVVGAAGEAVDRGFCPGCCQQPCDDEIGTAAGYTRVTGGKSGRPIDLSISDGRVHLLRAALGSHGFPRPERFAWSAVLICNPFDRMVRGERCEVK